MPIRDTLQRFVPQRVRASLADPDRRKRWKKWSIRGSAILFVAMVLLVVLVPTLLSWGPGASIVGAIASWSIPGQVRLKSISCGWLSGLYLRGIEIDTPDGDPVVRADRLDVTGAGLAGLAMGGRDLGNIAVDGLRLNVRRYNDGSINLTKAFGSSTNESSDEPLTLPPSMQADATVRNAEITVAAEGFEPVRFQLGGTSTINAGKLFESHLEVKVFRRSKPAGRFMVDATASRFGDERGRLQLAAAQFNIKSAVEGLRLRAIDQALGQSDLLATLLGPNLDAEMAADGQLTELQGSLTARSKTLTVDGGLAYDGQAIVSQPDSTLSFRLTPEGLAKLYGLADKNPATLVKPIDIEAKLRRFRLVSQNGERPHLHDARVDLLVSASDALLKVAGAEQELRLTDLESRIFSDALGKTIEFKAGAALRQGDQDGHVSLRGAIQQLFNVDDELQPTVAHANAGYELTGFDLAMIEPWLTLPSGVVPAVGPTLAGEGTFTVEPVADSKPGSLGWSLDGETQFGTTRAQINGKLTGGANLTGAWLDQGTGGSIELEPELLHRLLASTDANSDMEPPVTLVGPLVLRGQVDQAYASWEDGAAYGTARFSVDDIVLSHLSLGRVSLRGLTLSFDQLNPAKPSEIELQGKLGLGKNSADLAAQIRLTPDDKASIWSKLTGEFTLKKIPMSLAERITGLGSLSQIVIGPQIDEMRMDLRTTLAQPLDQVRFGFTIRSPHFDGRVDGHLENGRRIVIDPGLIAKLHVTPTMLQRLIGTNIDSQNEDKANTPVPGLQLNQPTEIDLKIARGEIGLNQGIETGSLAPDPTDVVLRGSLSMPNTSVTEKNTRRSFGVHGLLFQAKSNNLTKRLMLEGGFTFTDLNAEESDTPINGEFSTKTTVQNIFTKRLDLTLDKADIDSETGLTLPLAIVDAALGQGTNMAKALGPTAEANILLELHPDRPGTAEFMLVTPRAVNITFRATQPKSQAPFDWKLAARAEPLLVDAKANGSFDIDSMVLDLDRYESRTLITARRLSGMLAAMPASFTKPLREHQVAFAGTVKLKDGRLPLRNWRKATLQAMVTVDSTQAYYHSQRVPVRRSFARISVGDQVARLDHFTIAAMGGNLTMRGSTSLRNNKYDSTYRLDLADLDANSAIALLYPPSTLAGRTQGTINGVVRLNGPLAQITEHAGGSGRITVINGVLAPMPMISDIIHFLRLRNVLKQAGLNMSKSAIPTEGDDSAEVEFDFVGNAIRLTSTEINTSVININGSGDVGFDQKLDLELVADVMGSFVAKKIKVTGKANSPAIDPF